MLTTSTDQTLLLHGNSLRYRDIGQGEVVLLLHGWGGSLDSFSQVERYLSSNFRVLSLDLPGFGGSAPPPVPWSLDDYCASVEAFLGYLGLSRSVLLGHSFGGRIAIVLGAKGLASKLVLVDSAGVRPNRPPSYYAKVYSYKLAKRLLSLTPCARREPLLEKLQRRYGSGDYRNASPILRQTLIKVVNEDLTPLLPRIQAPTLLIWGDNDQTTPLYQAKTMEKLIPDAGLAVLKNAGHYCFLDKPQDFNIIVNHFLRH